MFGFTQTHRRIENYLEISVIDGLGGTFPAKVISTANRWVCSHDTVAAPLKAKSPTEASSQALIHGERQTGLEEFAFQRHDPPHSLISLKRMKGVILDSWIQIFSKNFFAHDFSQNSRILT